MPMIVKNSETLSILYSKPPQEFRKPKFKNGNKVRLSKYYLLFKNCFEPKYTQEVFEIFALFSRKPPTYTIKHEPGDIIHDKFHPKNYSKSISNGIVHNSVGF